MAAYVEVMGKRVAVDDVEQLRNDLTVWGRAYIDANGRRIDPIAVTEVVEDDGTVVRSRGFRGGGEFGCVSVVDAPDD